MLEASSRVSRKTSPFVWNPDQKHQLYADALCADLAIQTLENEENEIILSGDAKRIGKTISLDLDMYEDQKSNVLAIQTRVLLSGRESPLVYNFFDLPDPFIIRGEIQSVLSNTQGVRYRIMPDVPENNNYDFLRMTPDNFRDIHTRKRELKLLLDTISTPEDLPFPAQKFLSGDFQTEIPDGTNLERLDSLDDDQNQAYGRAMLGEKYPILMIHGGPGTGKTRTTAEIINGILKGHEERGQKVLLLSHSHKGAQVPALKLQEVANKKWVQSRTHVAGNRPDKVDSRLQKCRIKRGLPRYPQEVLDEIDAMTEEEALNWYFPDYVEFDRFSVPEHLGYLNFKREDRIKTAKWAEKKSILGPYDTALGKKEKKIHEDLKKGGVVVSTFGNLLRDKILAGIDFDVVIVDEATRMRSPELMMALKKAGKQIIFILDPKQLGNIPLEKKERTLLAENLSNPQGIQSETREQIEIIFEKSDAQQIIENIEKGPLSNVILNAKEPEKELPYVFLGNNRRSLPNITHVLSELIYDGKLKAARIPQEGEGEGLVKWFDTKNLGTREQSTGKSKKNVKEAKRIAKKVHGLLMRKNNPISPEDIAIISMYGAQSQRILKEFRYLQKSPSKRKNDLYERLKKSISTVDGFQGDERRFVFVSLTRSNEEGHIGFLQEQERLGVAIGRAQEQLNIYGNSDTVVKNNQNKESAELFSHLSQLVEKYGDRIELRK